MSDPVILFSKPGQISKADQAKLNKAGVIVIGVEDLESLWLTRAAPELSGSALLEAAARAIKQSEVATKTFGIHVCNAIIAERSKGGGQ